MIFCQFAAGSSDIRFTNVRVQILVPGFGCVFMANLARLSYNGCTFIGGNVTSCSSRQHAFENCSFLGANDSPMAIDQLGTSELSISDCTFANFDDTSESGQGLGRLLAANSDFGTLRDVYVGGNTTTNCGPRPGTTEQNSGEQILCEGTQSLFQGSPVASTAETLSLAGLSTDYTGQTVVVTRGKGLGQHRSVTAFDSNTGTLTVSPSWNVPPDATSTVIIAHAADRWVIYGNQLQGRSTYAAGTTAMTGIEPFGGCFDWIGDGNAISEMCYGLSILAVQQSAPIAGIAPTFFNYYVNNTIDSSYMGIRTGCGIPDASSDQGVGFIGTVFRHNRVTNITTAGVTLWTNNPATPGIPFDLTVFDNNSFQNLPEGFECDDLSSGSRVANALFLGNTIDAGSSASADAIGVHFAASTVSPGLQTNTWLNLANAVYTGTAPGGILELPERTFSLSGLSGISSQASMVILNSGTAPLSWTATSDSPWLSVSPSSSVVAGENSQTEVTLNCDPARLGPGSYNGSITISTGNQTKTVAVRFEVGTARSASGRLLLVAPAAIATVADQTPSLATVSVAKTVGDAPVSPAPRQTIAPRPIPALANSLIGGLAPAAVLAVPVNFLSVAGSPGRTTHAAIVVVNSGTAALDWQASSDSNWLTPSLNSGTLIDGRSSVSVTLVCDPTGLRPGSYVGHVTISGAAQAETVTVSFEVVPIDFEKNRQVATAKIPLAKPILSLLFAPLEQ